MSQFGPQSSPLGSQKNPTTVNYGTVYNVHQQLQPQKPTSSETNTLSKIQNRFAPKTKTVEQESLQTKSKIYHTVTLLSIQENKIISQLTTHKSLQLNSPGVLFEKKKGKKENRVMNLSVSVSSKIQSRISRHRSR